MSYPYLGIKKTEDGKNVVVLFTEVGKGVVVSNELQDPECSFGKYGDFDEEEFDFLPQNQCVRLNN